MLLRSPGTLTHWGIGRDKRRLTKVRTGEEARSQFDTCILLMRAAVRLFAMHTIVPILRPGTHSSSPAGNRIGDQISTGFDRTRFQSHT